MAPRIDKGNLLRNVRARLRVDGPLTAPELVRALRISQPTLSRVLRALGNEILRIGPARRPRYAITREVPRVGRTVPLYEVLPEGGHRRFAWLHAVGERGFFVEAQCEEVESRIYEDLPAFLDDLRPSGYLGRLVAREAPAGTWPDDPRDWSSGHTLHYLVERGWNGTGALIAGDPALGLWQERKESPPDGVHADHRARLYAERVEQLAQQTFGSSAGGEQPKFLATLMPERRSVLVKFSPPTTDARGIRWADLLYAEHLASEVLRSHGMDAVRTEVLRAGERVFLQVERFDRTQEGGRRGVISLAALSETGGGSSWGKAAAELATAGIIPVADRDRVLWLESFAELIQNSDRHAYNISFMTRGTRVLGLAPSYDMLPMAYAPTVDRTPDVREVRRKTAAPDISADIVAAVRAFWERVAAHPAISSGFKVAADLNLEELRGLAPRGRAARPDAQERVAPAAGCAPEVGSPPATYDDLLRLPEGVNGELIGGELFPQPRPGVPHAVAGAHLVGSLVGPFRLGSGGPGGWLILYEPELHLGPDVVVPDLAGWRQARVADLPRTPAITIAPDWVCEILSPATQLRDRGKKLPLYARAGVAHTWLIDPASRTVEVYRRAGDAWLVVATYGEDQRVRAEPFDAVELDLSLLWTP